MVCAECWTNVAERTGKCPRCGARLVAGSQPSLKGLLKANPWLVALLAASGALTMWALTRRAPAPPDTSGVIEKAIEPPAPPPAPEPEQEETPPPVFPEPVPVQSAPPPPPAAPAQNDAPPPPMGPTQQRADGTWGSGPANPGGR